jgi:hypothetical protein
LGILKRQRRYRIYFYPSSKKGKNSYKDVELDAIIDNLPSENNFDKLGFGEIKNDGFYFGGTFPGGKRRISCQSFVFHIRRQPRC